MATNQQSSLGALGNDILYEICSILAKPAITTDFKPLHRYERTVDKKNLAALASTSRLLREIAKPILFCEIIIREEFRSGGQWHRMAARTEKLLSDNESGGILQYVRTFEFSLRLDRDDFTQAPYELPYQLSDILLLLPKVRTLNILIPEHQADNFAEALVDHRFPLVEKLFVGAYNEFMVPLCPNVRTVWSEPRFGEAVGKRRGVNPHLHAMFLINAVLKVESVRELKISQEWTVDMVNALAAHPNNISLLSEISLSSNRSTLLSELLLPLSALRNLQTLELATTSSLNVGFNPPMMRIVTREIEVQRDCAQEKVVEMVEAFLGSGSLKRLLIGDEEFRTGAIFERRNDEELRRGDMGGESGRRVGNWVGLKTMCDIKGEKSRRQKRVQKHSWSRISPPEDAEYRMVKHKKRQEERTRQLGMVENRRLFELEEENRRRIAE